MLFIQLIYYFSRDRVPINNFPPFSAHKQTHNPRFLHSLQRRANARSFSFETLINVRNQLNWSCNTIWPFYNSLTHNEVKGSLELRPWSFRTTFHELLTKEKHLRNERYVWSETKPQKISALPQRLKENRRWTYVYENEPKITLTDLTANSFACKRCKPVFEFWEYDRLRTENSKTVKVDSRCKLTHQKQIKCWRKSS